MQEIVLHLVIPDHNFDEIYNLQEIIL